MTAITVESARWRLELMGVAVTKSLPRCLALEPWGIPFRLPERRANGGPRTGPVLNEEEQPSSLATRHRSSRLLFLDSHKVITLADLPLLAVAVSAHLS
jgi:hypothetical protein